MDALFDFQDPQKSEEILRITWRDFRSALAKHELQYDDTGEALKHTFLKVFDDMFDHMEGQIVRPISSLKGKVLLRGAKLDDAEIPSFDRFIPNAKYIKDDNRFSPPGVEWLYLAIDDNSDKALLCAKAECRANIGDRFGSCLFEINSSFVDTVIVDLTSADDKSFRDINYRLELAGQKYKDNMIKKA